MVTDLVINHAATGGVDLNYAADTNTYTQFSCANATSSHRTVILTDDGLLPSASFLEEKGLARVKLL